MNKISMINSVKAPEAVGPYSQAVAYQGTVYASGQIGLDPVTGKLVGDDVVAQAKQVTKNLTAVLQEAGVDLSAILKVNIFLTDMGDFPLINEVYANWLGSHRPARATVAVAALPLGALVEMDLVAAH
ncbi:MAG: Rid family detoxifying hydrolase [Mariprofundus sp.]|nr:Rid family detoxifying hydrolase [Mariprofundus sp.]